MMTNLTCDVIKALKGKTLVTAESCTGGGIGAALTSVPGSSEVFKGGIICYTNWVKENLLGVDENVLEQFGAVSEPVAKMMADLSTRMKITVNKSDNEIASIMTDGCNMGIKSLYKYLNQYEHADERSRDITNKLISIEQELRTDMRKFL